MLSTMLTLVRTRMDGDEGATALEYAVLVVAIVAALLLGATVFGEALRAFFANLFPL